MRRSLLLVTLLLTLSPLSQCFAQDMPGASQATEQHQWLQKFVGDWDVVSGGSMGEGQPEMEGKATMNSSMLGDLWIVNRSEHDINGQAVKAVQVIGYDPAKGKFIGMWADSFVSHMWQYEGELDESGNKLVLEAEGPSMMGDGKMVTYRDSYEFTDDDTIVSTSEMQGPNGDWVQIMKGKAVRRK